MKNVVDHRILLPKSPEVVWKYISDLSNNPSWQVDCKQVSFITSRHTGAGVRWRYQSSDEHDRVVETTAWYEGLGYEYSFVEGTPFQQSRGRIRLQEIPEGTIVQWTFSYDIKGFLGGVRNALSIRRQTENVMMDSLRMLWRKLNQAGTVDAVREAKSLIRDAPGYEERSRYKPRHPSKMEMEASVETAIPSPDPFMVEPPVTEEDTRPSIRANATAEPDFLSKAAELTENMPAEAEKNSVDASPFAPTSLPVISVQEIHAIVDEPLSAEMSVQPTEQRVAETQPNSLNDSVEKPKVEPEKPIEVTPPLVAESVHSEPTVIREVPAQEEVNVDLSRETTKTSAVDVPIEDVSSAPTLPVIREPIPPEKLEKADTREISVFEVFGLPKPSESQELPAVVLPPPESPKAPPARGRFGLRILLRRKLVRLRRPS